MTLFAGTARERRRLLVLSPYDVVPARYGGALRTFHVCRELSHHFDVRLFAQQVQRAQIAPTLAPRIVRFSDTFVQYSTRHPLSVALFALTAIVLQAPPVWQRAALGAVAPPWLHRELRAADVIQVEQPWQFEWVHGYVGGRKPVVLDTQNVEADLYGAEVIRAPGAIARRLAAAVAEQEAFAVRHASHVLAATPGDAEELARRYAVAAQRFTVVPNGVDCAGIVPATPAERAGSRAALGLSDRRVVLFVGSLARTNLEAATLVTRWAHDWPEPDVTFVVAGTVGEALGAHGGPRLRVTGRVDDVRPYLQAADVAVNPMLSGSGSNLKLVESMAAALPIVTTPVGARGIPVTDGVDAYVAGVEEFPARLRAALGDHAGRVAVGRAARRLVERDFDWKVVIQHVLPVYRALLGDAR